MPSTRLLLAALAATAIAAATTAPAIADDRGGRDRGLQPTYTIDGQDVFPEGVAFDGRNLYTSSVADGTVYRGSIRSTTLTPFLPGGADGRTAATGMTVTGDRLIVTGANTGRAWVYSTRTGELIAAFEVPDNAPGSTFVNDVTVTRDGTAYLTDSFRAVIYKIDAKEIRGNRADADGLLDVAFDTSVAPLIPGGFNANGIATTPDGRGLLVVYSAAGALYRVDLRTGSVAQVDLGGVPVPSGDGLVRDGKTLYVIQNFLNTILPIDLSNSGRRGVVGTGFSYDGADIPTTGVLVHDQLVVTNSQFDTLFGGAPLTSEIFSLSTVDLP